AAPIVMVLARLLQGFATGGEFASAMSFLIESAPADRRGFYGSWQMVGQGVAALLGALVSAAGTRRLSPEALGRWGWRMPFLFGLRIGPVGVYIRRHLDETEAFIEANATPGQEVGTLMATHFSEVMVCLGLAGKRSKPMSSCCTCRPSPPRSLACLWAKLSQHSRSASRV